MGGDNTYMFAFLFVQIAKGKLPNGVFMAFNQMGKIKKMRERLITAVGKENNVKYTVPPIDATLETPLQ